MEDRSGGQGLQTTKEIEMIRKSRENFIPAAQGLQPGISVSFISFGLICCVADQGSAL